MVVTMRTRWAIDSWPMVGLSSASGLPPISLEAHVVLFLLTGSSRLPYVQWRLLDYVDSRLHPPRAPTHFQWGWATSASLDANRRPMLPITFKFRLGVIGRIGAKLAQATWALCSGSKRLSPVTKSGLRRRKTLHAATPPGFEPGPPCRQATGYTTAYTTESVFAP